MCKLLERSWTWTQVTASAVWSLVAFFWRHCHYECLLLLSASMHMVRNGATSSQDCPCLLIQMSIQSAIVYLLTSVTLHHVFVSATRLVCMSHGKASLQQCKGLKPHLQQSKYGLTGQGFGALQRTSLLLDGHPPTLSACSKDLGLPPAALRLRFR